MSVEWWSVKGAFPFFFPLSPRTYKQKQEKRKLKSWQSTQHVKAAAGNSADRKLFSVSLAKHKLAKVPSVYFYGYLVGNAVYLLC